MQKSILGQISIKKNKVNYCLLKKNCYVSHSIVHYKNGHSTEAEYIKIETASINSLVHEFRCYSLPITKLAVEGRGTEDVEDLFSYEIFSNQKCIEFDEILKLKSGIKSRFYNIHFLYRQNAA